MYIYIYIYIYIYPMHVLVFQRKPCLHLLNRLNSETHATFWTHVILQNLEGNLWTWNMIITKKSSLLYFVVIVTDKI